MHAFALGLAIWLALGFAGSEIFRRRMIAKYPDAGPEPWNRHYVRLSLFGAINFVAVVTHLSDREQIPGA